MKHITSILLLLVAAGTVSLPPSLPPSLPSSSLLPHYPFSSAQVLAQEKLVASLVPGPILVPVTLRPPPPPPPPPVCFADAKLKVETAADTEDAEEDDEDPASGAPDSLTYFPPQRRCEDGPVRVSNSCSLLNSCIDTAVNSSKFWKFLYIHCKLLHTPSSNV